MVTGTLGVVVVGVVDVILEGSSDLFDFFFLLLADFFFIGDTCSKDVFCLLQLRQNEEAAKSLADHVCEIPARRCPHSRN